MKRTSRPTQFELAVIGEVFNLSTQTTPATRRCLECGAYLLPEEPSHECARCRARHQTKNQPPTLPL